MKQKTCCFTGHRDIPLGDYQLIFDKTEEMVVPFLLSLYGVRQEGQSEVRRKESGEDKRKCVRQKDWL